MIDVSAVKQVMERPFHRAVFAAALLLANEGGATVAELAAQLGVGKGAIRRFTRQARARRQRQPRAWLVYSAAIEGAQCDHASLFGPGLRICLDCLMSNQPDHPALRRHQTDEPAREPSKSYRPGRLRGGLGVNHGRAVFRGVRPRSSGSLA